MAESYEKSSVILLHRPPYTGKPDSLRRLLSQTHTCICPEDLFEKNPAYGLRDVALVVVQKLQKGGNVIIDSENATTSSRLSFIALIRKRLPHLSMSIVEILPKYGCLQLFWAREHDLARKTMGQSGNIQSRMRDNEIVKWFASEEATDVTYRKGTVEAPKEGEGAKIHKLKVGLVCESVYKLEVPALFIQWDVLQTHSVDGKLKVGAVTKVLKQWSSLCPYGRIIVLCDGMSMKSGVRNCSQAFEEIASIMKQLTESFSDIPVYALAITNPGRAGGFVVPPRPGLIAYLQRRHCLDLHSKYTLYLYESQHHMKMAERAGVPHMKIASRHAATIPSIPDMLKTMEMKESADEEYSGAIIPLFDLIEEFRDGYLKQTSTFGRTEYLFAKDRSCIERYQTTYANKASKVSEPDSKIIDELENQSAVNQPVTSQLNTSANISRTVSESRDLPKWMLPKDRSNSSVNSSLEMSRSDSASSADVKIKHTVYVMTEKELTEVAMDILKQAGRTELVEQFKARKQQQQEKSNKDTCSVSQKKRTQDQHKQSKRKKTKQCNIEREREYHSKTEHSKNRKGNAVTDLNVESDSGMSLSDNDSWHSENESAHKHHIDMETDRSCVPKEHLEEIQPSDHEKLTERNEKLHKKQYHTEDVVNEALDDLLNTSSVERKTRLKPYPATPSPVKSNRKRTVEEENPSSSSKRTFKSRLELECQTDIGEANTSQKQFNRNILGKTGSTASLCFQSTETSDRNAENEARFARRKTPDLTILDELFG